MDFSHLNSLEYLLSRAKEYAFHSPTAHNIIQVQQLEREIVNEYKFLGIESAKVEMTDDELLQALSE